MKTIQLPGIPFEVSQVCLGCAYLGSREDDETSFAIMDAYYEAGGRFLNTAHEYGGGLSERIIGRWVRERGVRDSVIVTSKCGEDRTKPFSRAMRPAELFEDIDETLSRSGFDCVDFYLLHLDDPAVPVSDIVGTMEEIRRRGKIRFYGCSNWSVGRMTEASGYAAANGCQGFVLNEIEMNLTRRNTKNSETIPKWLDDEYIAYHRKTGMPVAAYSPIASAVLTKYLRDGNMDAWTQYQVTGYDNEYNFEIARRLGKLSRETGFSTTQIQLAFVLAQPYGFACFPILGARTVEQLKDSLGGLSCPMTRDMIGYLTQKEACI